MTGDAPKKPVAGGKGVKFSKENQPDRQNPVKRKKSVKLLQTMLQLKVDSSNLILKKLKRDVPHLFEEEDGTIPDFITIEAALFARMIREALMNPRPLPYFKEIMDRLHGKPAITVKKEDDVPVVDHDERNRILQEKIKKAELAKERRENEANPQ